MSGPPSSRASISVVATLTSAALSRWQSSIVRTLWPDLEADVPEEGEEPLDAVVTARDTALRQQDHHVDVGAGVQLAAAVAADGDQRHVALAGAGMQAPRASQHEVDHPRAVAHQHLDGLVVGEALAQVFVAASERATECRDRIGSGVERGVQRLEEGPRRENDPTRGCLAAVGRDRRRRAQTGTRSFEPSVSTSTPVSVTRTVCSHCADRE